MRLDAALSRRAVQAGGKPLGMSVEDAAQGVHRIASAHG
jgi:hypothetical protein